MKKQLKGFILGFAIGALLMSTTILADDITTMIEVVFDSVKIKVNGKDVQTSNILYEGRTYVPLRAISEMLDKNVEWDPETGTAYINDKDFIAAPDLEIATVNGEKITFEEYRIYYNIVNNQLKASGNQADAETVKQMALENVIKNKIQLQKAANMNITLSTDELRDIEAQKAYYVDIWGGQEKYEKNLREMGLSDQSFIQFLKEQMLINKLYRKIVNIEVEDDVTEQQMKEYYKKNIDKYRQAKAKHILISTVDKNGMPLSEEEQETASKKIQDIYQRIKAGEDFDKLMHEFSEDPGLASYPDGYTVIKGQMVPEFEKAVFSMKKDEISSPIKSVYGYHIIKVVEELYELPFEEVKDHIQLEISREQQNVRQQKYEQQIMQWKNEANIQINEAEFRRLNMK